MLKVHNKAIGRLLRRSGIAGALLYLWEFNTTCHLSTGIRGDVQIRLRLCIIRAVYNERPLRRCHRRLDNE